MSNDIQAKKSKKDKNIIDENDEILSDSDLDEDQNDNKLNGNVRLDDLLLNEEHEDDETNFHEQKLQRAKEYIEQIAKQGLTVFEIKPRPTVYRI